MPGGSKKPILKALPGGKSESSPNSPMVTLKNGQTMTAIECLYKAGDLLIAAERTGLSDLEFAHLLTSSDPQALAEVLSAIQILDTFTLRSTMQRQLMAKLETLEPKLLLRHYAEISRLLPEQAASRIQVLATQNNLNVQVSPAGGGKLPAHILEALEALGLDPEINEPRRERDDGSGPSRWGVNRVIEGD